MRKSPAVFGGVSSGVFGCMEYDETRPLSVPVPTSDHGNSTFSTELKPPELRKFWSISDRYVADPSVVFTYLTRCSCFGCIVKARDTHSPRQEPILNRRVRRKAEVDPLDVTGEVHSRLFTLVGRTTRQAKGSFNHWGGTRTGLRWLTGI